MSASLVGSEMCIRDSPLRVPPGLCPGVRDRTGHPGSRSAGWAVPPCAGAAGPQPGPGGPRPR
eukprot:13597271-Alexandrium_andersonii.AAC.1